MVGSKKMWVKIMTKPRNDALDEYWLEEVQEMGCNYLSISGSCYGYGDECSICEVAEYFEIIFDQ